MEPLESRILQTLPTNCWTDSLATGPNISFRPAADSVIHFRSRTSSVTVLAARGTDGPAETLRAAPSVADREAAAVDGVRPPGPYRVCLVCNRRAAAVWGTLPPPDADRGCTGATCRRLTGARRTPGHVDPHSAGHTGGGRDARQ